MLARTLMGKILIAASTAIVAQVGSAQVVSAQIVFDWGGDEEWGGKRETVRFNSTYKPGQLIVSFSDRRLYYVNRAGQAISYPIAAPREQSRWQGVTTVSQKRENPSWTPTPEMVRENPRLPRWVPGGHPMNPLGVRALYLGASTYRIHGTDAPWTIGQAVSKGCIRMYNADVIELYKVIPVGTKVTVTWQRFRTAALSSADVAEDSAQDDLQRRATFKRRATSRAPAAQTAAAAQNAPSGQSDPTQQASPSGDTAAPDRNAAVQ